MKVFLFTSVPLAPPWDQGDKILAHSLTQALPEIQFQVMTSRNQAAPKGYNLHLNRVYASQRPAMSDKMKVYAWLLRRQFQPAGWANGHHGAFDPGPPDLTHFIYRPVPFSSGLLRLLPEIRRRPSVHTLTSSAQSERLKASMFFSDRVVTTSAYGCQILRKMGLENITHIPLGVDMSRWVGVQEQAEEYKSRLGVEGHPVLLFPGHYGPQYGSGVVLEALPDIMARLPELRVIFACRIRSEADRLGEHAARQRVEQAGLSHAVRFFSTVADMRELIGASDLVALPLQTMRNKVDLPITLLEAMSAGKPVLVSDIPPMNELIHNYPRGTGGGKRRLPHGCAVPPGDAAEFANAVVNILKDQSVAAEMGAEGENLVRQHFDIQRIAPRYAELYEDLLR